DGLGVRRSPVMGPGSSRPTAECGLLVPFSVVSFLLSPFSFLRLRSRSLDRRCRPRPIQRMGPRAPRSTATPPPTPAAAPAKRAVIRIGTQGWNYPAWLGPFYPVEAKPSDFLSVYARAFD